MMGRGSIAELPMPTRFTRRQLATVGASALGASATAVPSGARARDGAVAGREASRAFPAGFLWGTATRVTALLMLRSTMKTVSAPASRSFRGSLPHPTQPLCTLRVRRHRRLTQHSLPGGLLDLTWAGLAPADRASFAWRLPVAVGTCVSSHAPRTEPYVRLSRIRLPPRVCDGEAFARPGLQNGRLGSQTSTNCVLSL